MAAQRRQVGMSSATNLIIFRFSTRKYCNQQGVKDQDKKDRKQSSWDVVLKLIGLVLIKKVLKFVIAFQKDCKKKLVAARIKDIAEDMMGSDFLARIIVSSSHEYVKIDKMILKLESVDAR